MVRVTTRVFDGSIFNADSTLLCEIDFVHEVAPTLEVALESIPPTVRRAIPHEVLTVEVTYRKLI